MKDTKQAFLDSGLSFYNDLVYLTPIGTKPLYAPRQFLSGRKAGKVHQNLLVFYKGDPSKCSKTWSSIGVNLRDFEDQIGGGEDPEVGDGESG